VSTVALIICLVAEHMDIRKPFIWFLAYVQAGSPDVLCGTTVVPY